MRKVIAIMVACMMAVCAFAPAASFASNAPTLFPGKNMPSYGNMFVGLPGTYENVAVESVLARINQIRKEAYNEGLADRYAPIKWSDALEYMAQIRAAEAAAKETHQRPNGTYMYNMNVNGVKSYAENLAWGVNAIRAVELWYSEKADLVGRTGGETGHYEALIDPHFTHIGIGSFKSDERWQSVAAEFTSASGLSEERTGIRGKCVQMIEVPVSQVSMHIEDTDEYRNWREDEKGPVNAYGEYGTCKRLFLQDVVWTSSNENVITVSSDGWADALSVGKVVLTAQCGSLSDSLEITVHENEVTPLPTFIVDDDWESQLNKDKQKTTTPAKPTKLPVVKKPAKPVIIKVTAKNKGFTVKWKKSKRAKGYQIRYSTKKNFKSNVKVKKVASAKVVTKTIMKLKGKKKYYVQVRAYNEAGKSAWSAKKVVKTKK